MHRGFKMGPWAEGGGSGIVNPEKMRKELGHPIKFSSNLCYSFKLKPKTLKLRLGWCCWLLVWSNVQRCLCHCQKLYFKLKICQKSFVSRARRAGGAYSSAPDPRAGLGERDGEERKEMKRWRKNGKEGRKGKGRKGLALNQILFTALF